MSVRPQQLREQLVTQALPVLRSLPTKPGKGWPNNTARLYQSGDGSYGVAFNIDGRVLALPLQSPSGGSPGDTTLANHVANVSNPHSVTKTQVGLANVANKNQVAADGSQELTANWDAGSFEVRAETFESDVATGAAPMVVASTTKVTNLNADLLDGEEATAFQDQSARLDLIAALTPTAFTQTHSTADATLSAYTPDDESGAYSGIDNLQVGSVYAQVADLNALRAAYENLRAFTEDLAAFVNSLIDTLQTIDLVD